MAAFQAATPDRATRVLHIATLAALWLIVACGAVTFGFFLWTTPTRWFNYRSTEFIDWRNTLVLQYNFINATTGKSQPVLSSTFSFVLIWQWCGTLAVALAAAGLHWLSTGSKPSTANSTTTHAPAKDIPAPSKPRRVTFLTATKRSLRRLNNVLHLRLPPRGLWRTLLGPGGLTVLDLLLISAWFALHAMWMYEMTSRALEVRRMAPPPPRVLVRSPPALKTPTSSPANVTANLTAPAVKVPPPPAASLNATRRLLQTNATAALNSTIPKNTTTTALKAPSPPAVKTVKKLPRTVQGSLAKYWGWVAQMDIMLLFYPLPRCNFLHWIVGSDFTSMIKYHRWLGHGALLACSLHGIMYLALWTHDGTLSTSLKFGMSGTNMVAGLVALVGGWVLWVTSIPAIRRGLFNLFYTSHILGSIVFMLFTFMHYKDCAAWMMAGVFMYLLDVALRTVQQAFNWTRISVAADASSAAAVHISPNGTLLTLSLKCHESINWLGSDIVCLNVPAVSWWQWHPLTLASSSNITYAGGARRMVLHIKKYNRWTQRLFTRLATDQTSLKLYVSGPYSSANRKWLKGFDRHVFIAGGVGVTPAFGMLLEIIAYRRAHMDEDGRVTLIWMSRSMDELSTLPLEILQEASRGDESWLDLQLYLTSTAEPPAAAQEPPASAPASVHGSASPSILATLAAAAPLEVPAAGAGSSRTSQDGAGHSSAEITATMTEETTVVVKPPTAAPAADVAASENASTTAKATGPLAHPYMFSPLLWMAALLLCFGGGFAGLICADAYDARIIRTVSARNDYSYVGMLQFAALGVGAFVPPALLMLVAHLYRRIARVDPAKRKTASFDDSFTYGGPSITIAAPPAEINRLGSVTASHYARSSVISIDHSLCEFALPHDLHEEKKKKGHYAGSVVNFPGASIESFILPGRPNLAPFLADLAACRGERYKLPVGITVQPDASKAPEDLRVAVFAAGPTALVEHVEEVCAQLNGVWGRSGSAYLEVRELTHEL